MELRVPATSRHAGKVELYRWWSASPLSVIAVAKRGAVDDWAAYISGVQPWPIDQCISFATTNGAKLTEAEAAWFFPEMVALAEREGLRYRP